MDKALAELAIASRESGDLGELHILHVRLNERRKDDNNWRPTWVADLPRLPWQLFRVFRPEATLQTFSIPIGTRRPHIGTFFNGRLEVRHDTSFKRPRFLFTVIGPMSVEEFGDALKGAFE